MSQMFMIIRTLKITEIQGAKSTNTFISQPKEKYVESLFEELVTKTGFNSFEEVGY